jgi:hypothetical protein
MIPPPFCRFFEPLRFFDAFFGALRFIPPPFMLLARFFFPWLLHPHDGMLQGLWHVVTFKL